jgi:hypothetical protein
VVWASNPAGSNDILNELKLELKLAQVLNEPSLSTHFITRLEFELDYLSLTYKLINLEILKLSSARLNYHST